MAKDPAQRYQTPRELAADLDGWLLADRSGSDSRGMLASTILGSSAPTIMMADAVSRAEAGLPLNPNTPNGASVAPTPPAPIAVRRKSFPWPLGLVAAVIIGLASALLLPPPTGTRSDRDRGRGLRLTGANVPEEPSVFEVEGVTDRLPNLAAAVAAAPHGGTITIHGNGPFSVRTIQARGKALTIKAATAVRPRLRFAPPANSQPWEALLATDQPLRLDGLELVHETRAAGSEPSPAHLVYVDKASLHLTDCIIHAPQGTACVVCRACRDVRMEGCRFVAAALALCVETGNAHTDVMLHNSRLSVQTPRSAALSFWAAETGGNGALRLRLEGCAIEAGRPIAFGALPHGVAVSALHNHFSFHEALVSFANARGPAELRHAATWQEDGNVYDSHGVAWLHMNGGPAGIRDLSEWRKLWDGGRASTERETAAAAPASPARAE
jgi:hypothetical protein